MLKDYNTSMLIAERVSLVIWGLFKCGNLGFMIVVYEVLEVVVQTLEDQIVSASVDQILAICTTEYKRATTSSCCLWVRYNDIDLPSGLGT